MPQNKQKRDAFFDGNTIPGMPGYRTREGRSGLDPLETSAEASQMEGIFYRRLFTFKLRTRKLSYLLLMAAGGLIPFIMLSILIIDQYARGENPGFYLCIPGIYMVISGSLSINFILSIIDLLWKPVEGKKELDGLQKTFKKKKKQPKRRKDFGRS